MKKIRFFLIIFPLILGIVIYILYRSRNLYYYKLVHFFLMHESINIMRNIAVNYRKIFSTWVIYSLPDGLWLFSTGVAFLFYRKCFLMNFVFYNILFVLTILAEFIQKYFGGHGTFIGTFDIHDIYAYIIAYISSVIISIISILLIKNNLFFKINKQEFITNLKFSFVFSILAILPSMA